MKEWFSKNSNLILPLFVTSVFSIVNVVFAAINAKNAKYQKERAQTQICISLMEKRAGIHYAFGEMLSSIILNGEANLNDFLYETRECEFLFESDIVELRDTIYQTALKIKNVKKKILFNKNDPKHGDWCDQEYELSTEISEILNNLASYFKDYLDLSEYKIPKTKMMKN